MDDVYETVDDRSFKQKWKDFWGRRKMNAEAAGKWIKDNPKESVVLVLVLFTGGVDLAKTHAKSVERKEDRKMRDRFVYDERNHHWVEAKKKLTDSQRAEIDRRKKNGEDVYDILVSMRLK